MMLRKFFVQQTVLEISSALRPA